MAAGTEECARTRRPNLSLRPRSAGVRPWPALETRSSRLCPRAARLSPALVAAVESARNFPLTHREFLVGRLQDRGHGRGRLGSLCLVRG